MTADDEEAAFREIQAALTVDLGTWINGERLDLNDPACVERARKALGMPWPDEEVDHVASAVYALELDDAAARGYAWRDQYGTDRHFGDCIAPACNGCVPPGWQAPA